MNVLIWRGFVPAFREGLTFSTLEVRGVGGTEAQALLHAANLQALGHRVQVLGLTPESVTEQEIEFVGSSSQESQAAAIREGRISPPAVVFLEGAYHGAEWLRATFPSAKIVHVGQNIDRHAAGRALAQAPHVDRFAFVSVGHFADYCIRRPDLRHKFALVRNAVAWEAFHSQVPRATVAEKVVWVGSWQKKGLRTWFEVMARLLADRPETSWTLCGPQYSSEEAALPRHLYAGLSLPWDRIRVVSLPPRHLLSEIASARAVIASLGDETAGISTLDAHAMGRPVITGNDIVYKFVNPDGTGLRVSRRGDAYDALSFLMSNPEAGDHLGAAGRAFVRSEYSAVNQKQDLQSLVHVLTGGSRWGDVPSYPAPTKWAEWSGNFWETARRRWRRLIAVASGSESFRRL
jgi:glycosyltransferase involved in cell wall biosynthesis